MASVSRAKVVRLEPDKSNSQFMQPNSKVKAAHIIPWDIEEWGVHVEYEDGTCIGYRMGAREKALAHVAKIRSDATFAAMLRRSEGTGLRTARDETGT
jgi:hypothetical protein